MVDWNAVTMDDMIKALGKLVKNIEGKYTFDVTVFDDDGNEKDAFFITAEGGNLASGKGASGEGDAVVFHIKKGGMETMKAMQVEGLAAAMRFMFDGSIYTTNPAGAQKWFELFELGEEPLEKALS
ncbi:MAG TPA: hypothetical protein PLQ76_02760 [bacterium]|nr:hypothetical protein [bacterium]